MHIQLQRRMDSVRISLSHSTRGEHRLNCEKPSTTSEAPPAA